MDINYNTALGGAKGQKTLYSDNPQNKKNFFSHQNLPPSLIF